MLVWRNNTVKTVPLISTRLPQVCPGPAITSLLSPNWLVGQLFFLFFLMWTFFKKKREIRFVTVASVLCFDILALWGMWDVSSLTGDQTYTYCTGAWSLNHWTIRKVSGQLFLFLQTYNGIIYWVSSALNLSDRHILPETVVLENCQKDEKFLLPYFLFTFVFFT